MVVLDASKVSLLGMVVSLYSEELCGSIRFLKNCPNTT